VEKHSILGGKVHIYRRENSARWQCSTYMQGKDHRRSTGTDSLSLAKQFAEDWYFGLRVDQKEGRLKTEKTFRDAATQYEREYDIITGGERNRTYVDGNFRRIRKYLVPFFGELGLSEVTSAKIQEYRIFRQTPDPETGKVPARNTLHQETVTLRQVLKTAMRHDWLSHLPDMTAPYKGSGKVSHRAWFSPDEYKRLYQATGARAEAQKGKRWQREAEQLHDYVLFMANTGLRPDEANRLQYRDVEIADDKETGKTILIIEVRGKRGVGYCKSMPQAVHTFERMVERNKPKGSDPIFTGNRQTMFNNILDELELKFDREGNRRTAYSLRHTYISLRLMDGADIYQIAKNCRTSVEMIEKYYASHIKTSISAAAINVRKKPIPKRKQEELGIRNAHRMVE
jgi:integrase